MLKEEVLKLNNMKIYIPVIAVAESWLKPSIANAQVNIPDYNIFRADRELSKNGGVLLYIHEDIVIESSSSFDDNFCEIR